MGASREREREREQQQQQQQQSLTLKGPVAGGAGNHQRCRLIGPTLRPGSRLGGSNGTGDDSGATGDCIEFLAAIGGADHNHFRFHIGTCLAANWLLLLT